MADKLVSYEHKLDINETMQKYGGSFVKAYAEAWRKADLDNQHKLEVAFPELWDHYGAMTNQINGRFERGSKVNG